MDQKIKNYIQLALYILLPIVLMALYRHYYISTYTGAFANGMALMSCTYVLNALAMFYIINIEIEELDKVFFILDIVCALVYGSLFILILVPALTILSPIANLFYANSMLSHLWFACFLYRLIIRGIKYYNTKKGIEL